MPNINYHQIKDLDTYSVLCPQVEKLFFIRVRNGKNSQLYSPRTFAGRFGVEVAVNLFAKVLRSSKQSPVFKRSFGLVTFLNH